jgi:hypothetical protein
LQWLGLNRHYFSETEGPIAILPMRRGCDTFIRTSRAYSQKIKEYGFFPDLISNGNLVDRVHSMWTRRRARVHGGPGGALRSTVDQAAAPRYHVGARGHRCSPAVAGEGKEDEAELVRGSSELELWWRGGATELKNGDGLSSVREAWDRGEKVRWWLGFLRGLYRGSGERRGGGDEQYSGVSR